MIRGLLVGAVAACLACSSVESLTHSRPRPPECRAREDGAAVVCGSEVAASLRCTKRGYAGCNELVLTYRDGEAVTLHALRGDPKFDVVASVAMDRSGDRIWFTQSDLSVWAGLLGREGGFSRQRRVYETWTGAVRRDADPVEPDARVSRRDAVPLASEVNPSPGAP